MDLNTEAVLYSKNANTQLYPASITKLLTCLLGCENLDVNAQLTLPSRRLTELKLELHHLWWRRRGFYSWTMSYGTDAGISQWNGTWYWGRGFRFCEEFVELMNTRAQQLGCTNTHFNNPNGLPDETHVTTANDMAKIASSLAECHMQEVFHHGSVWDSAD